MIVANRPEEEEKLLLIQGIANTKLMTKYHDLVFSNKLYAGRRRYFSQYIQNYPLPDINTVVSKNIIKLTKQLNATTTDVKLKKLTNALEVQVAKAFGVDPVLNLD